MELNDKGYIITDNAQKTNIAGVYAAGDVCIKPLRQVVTATGDGALAATELEKYVTALHRKTGLRAAAPEAKPNKPAAAAGTQPSSQGGELFTPEMRQQLDSVFSRMASPLLLKLRLDQRPISVELENFAKSLAELTSKLSVTVERRDAPSEKAPCMAVCKPDGEETGLAFHGVPGGHEFTSFVLGLYNAAGPGQSLDEETRQRIAAIAKPTNLKILVTLSCSMCPDLVLAAQRIAAENPNVTAHVYDISHFEGLRKRYNVMSVPCLVVNDEQVFFGKKNLPQLLELLSQ